jgi:FtsH-binding integral membrane protein
MSLSGILLQEVVMRIDPRAIGSAAGITAAILFVVCAVAVAIAPGFTTSLAGLLFHLDLSGITRHLTWVTFLGGLVAWSLGTALTFGFTARLYNRFIGTSAV